MNIGMFIVFFVLVAIIIITIIVIAVKKEKEIYKNGIETDSYVVKVDQRKDHDHITRYHCYVKYLGDDNMEHEALLNASLDAPIGRKVKIKFLSGKYDYVVFISQEIE